MVAQGVPFIRNFTAEEYGAQNQNFDIMSGSDGTIYVANFEGLLYYDHAQWRIIHAPGITRMTAIFRSSKDVIWTGGFNYIGYIDKDERGCLMLRSLNATSFHGEINWIWETDGNIYFLTSSNDVFRIEGNNCKYVPNARIPNTGFATLENQIHINQRQQLDDGLTALATNGHGVIIVNEKNETVITITEDNGLCSNNVAHLTYNRKGQLWGATDNGVFVIEIPSCYTHFAKPEGLRGEVVAIQQFGNDIYAGTLRGLYRKQGYHFEQIRGMNYSCWQIVQQDNHLLVATMDGIFRINADHTVHQLTHASALSLMTDEQNFYSGEMDGLYYNTADGKRKKLNDVEKVIKIFRDKSGSIWLQTIYGNIWKSKVSNQNFIAYTSDRNVKEVATLVVDNGNIKPIMANSTKPFPYPYFSYTDKDNIFWLTNNKGKMIYAYKDHAVDQKLSTLLKPFEDFTFRSAMVDNNLIWLGGKEGISVIDLSQEPLMMKEKPHISIRSITNGIDSILWGGYGKSISHLEMSSTERNLTITYGLNYTPIIGRIFYRFRINKGKWSNWQNDCSTELTNQPYGKNTFEVQGRDNWGRMTDITLLEFIIERPFYMRWYMNIFYVIILLIIFYLLFRLRLRRLEKEKVILEGLVQERTSQVVRLEKMATVGKLTQGLIDRILNPMNYINNFAKLSIGLVKDVAENIEDEKDHINQENYEDTVEVLDMLKGNLQKVGEHGANTARMLKAMEEMLKDRSGHMKKMDLTEMLKEDHSMLLEYFVKDIEKYHIHIHFDLPDNPVYINGNIEQLSKMVMSLLGNSVYAVIKKVGKVQDIKPEISLTLKMQEQQAVIRIYDNGTGISENVLAKIFDPFFTTKTTSEAAGIGLYLSKEIAQNHGGDITAESEKLKYTTFTITLPTI